MLNNLSVDVEKMLNIYEISKRTLFYDLEEINYEIGAFGKLKVIQDEVVVDGNLDAIKKHLSDNVLIPYYQAKERQERILLTVLENKKLSLDDYVDLFNVSKSTIFSNIETLRAELAPYDIQLEYEKQYKLKGSERKIRDMYLQLLSLKTFDYEKISKAVIQFNQEHQLHLSDYSMYYLSSFIEFIQARYSQHDAISDKLGASDYYLIDDINLDVQHLLQIDNVSEQRYLKSYILSLSTITHKDVTTIVKQYVHELLHEVKVRLALDLEWNQALISNLENHLMASFYRIHFNFAALNPTLTDIKVKYFYLFLNVKSIIRSLNHQSVFYKMRDEEIGFVVAYLGGYIYESLSQIGQKQYKVILICPQGRAVAQHLKAQLENTFPEINIIGAYSINQLGYIIKNYDYIITTLELPHYQNVIKVQPILSEYDKQQLENLFGLHASESLLSKVMTVVENHTLIKDRESLMSALENVLGHKHESRRYQPMLQELIKAERIQVVDYVPDWEQAIALASQPLLDASVIEQAYIDAMIAAIHEFGPYIVLADEFALPHASNAGHVKEVAIALLVLEEAVDLLGKPVKVFMVLATIDNQSHLKALASLTNILSEDENLELIKKGNIDEIVSLFKGGSK
jgi:transcriptional antiterminator